MSRVPDSDVHGRRRGVVIALAALAGLLALVAVAMAVTAGGEDESPEAGRPTTSPSSSTVPEPGAPESTPLSAGALEQFAQDYVNTASTDPGAGFAYLTPEYQVQSPRYAKVWRAIEDPVFLSISADPGALTVTYTYRYRLRGSGRRTEEVTLQLVETDGRLLIAGGTARQL